MITSSTKVEGNKFKVTFDFTPDDVRHSRTNGFCSYTATHLASGTTSRQGVWEGVQIVEVQTRVGNGSWTKHGTNKVVTVTVDSNNVSVQATAKYKITTMGYHWKDKKGKYPFFWYGNIGGTPTNEKPSRYEKGDFRDSSPSRPDGDVNKICVVPPDWKYSSISWSAFAKNHAASTPNWSSLGDGEKRNGNYESAKDDNGWISDSNRKQTWRKSCTFTFVKDYSATVNSSGIAVNPSNPTIAVPAYKGDNGKVETWYNANGSGNGFVTVEAKCNGITKTVTGYGIEYGDGWKKTYDVNFVSLFGNSSRSNDVYYRAKAKNKHGYESAWTDWKGVQRFNGIPTAPTNVNATGDKFNSSTIKWSSSWDGDGDSLTYSIWLRIYNKSGGLVKDEVVASGIKSCEWYYDMRGVPEGALIQTWVRASDGIANSEWSAQYDFNKGEKPTNVLKLISPMIENATIYSSKPRFVFNNHDRKSTVNVTINGSTYNSSSHSSMFDISGSTVIFRYNNPCNSNSLKLQAWLENSQGKGPNTKEYVFVYATPKEDVVEGNYISYMSINSIYNTINKFSEAYSKKFESNIAKHNIYKAETYNNCLIAINNINNGINSHISNSKFNYKINCTEVIPGVTPADDMLWENLINELKNI